MGKQPAQRRARPASWQVTLLSRQGEGNRAIEHPDPQARDLPDRLPEREQAVPQPAQQGGDPRQRAEQSGGGERLQAGIGPGDLVGAQHEQGQAHPEKLRGEEVMGAAGQQRAPAQQRILKALAGDEGV